MGWEKLGTFSSKRHRSLHISVTFIRFRRQPARFNQSNDVASIRIMRKPAHCSGSDAGCVSSL
jgi:hypothetical protein